MPEVARGDRVDQVRSQTGSGNKCAFPTLTSTDERSPNVRVNGVGAVRLGDKVLSHSAAGCVPESPPLSTASKTVRVNGRGIGRKGDNYVGSGYNLIETGSSNVRAGG